MRSVLFGSEDVAGVAPLAAAGEQVVVVLHEAAVGYLDMTQHGVVHGAFVGIVLGFYPRFQFCAKLGLVPK